MDNTVTIAELADKWGISYQAARKFVQRHQKEIAEHIHRPNKGRLQTIDETGVKMLEERRQSRPVIVRYNDRTEEIDELRKQLESLRALYNQSQAKLVAVQNKVIEMHEQAEEALVITGKYNLLMMDHEQLQNEKAVMRSQLEVATSQIDELRKRAEDAEAIADSFRPSVFGFYRRKR